MLAVVAAGRVRDECVIGRDSASEWRWCRRRVVVVVQVVLSWCQLTQANVPASNTVLYHVVVEEHHVRVHVFLPI